MPHLAFLVAIVPLHKQPAWGRSYPWTISDHTHSGQATSAALIEKTTKPLNCQLSLRGALHLFKQAPPHTTQAKTAMLGFLPQTSLISMAQPWWHVYHHGKRHASAVTAQQRYTTTHHEGKDSSQGLPSSASASRHALARSSSAQLWFCRVPIRRQIYYVTKLFLG